MLNLKKLPHPGIGSLTPYQAGKSIEQLKQELGLKHVIKLASNENPLGCSPLAQEAIRALPSDKLALYPAVDYHPLKPTLAKKLNIGAEHVSLGSGSDSLFVLLMIAFALHQKKHILTHEGAFITYKIQAQVHGIPCIETPLNEDFTVNIDALIHRCNPETGLIFIANPNNPSGIPINMHDIKRILDNIPETTLLVLDEAYFEFANVIDDLDAQPFLKNYPNLVITRTFSKAYGLAGLRLGYSLSHPDIAEIIHRIQLPFAINQVALYAGMAALNDTPFLTRTLENNREGMIQMIAGLTQLPVSYLPSHGNFLMIDCKKNATPLFQELQQKGIIVRPLAPYGYMNHLRVTIGTPDETAAFLAAFSELLTA